VLNPTLYAKDKLSYDTERDLLPITGLVRINQALIATTLCRRRTCANCSISPARSRARSPTAPPASARPRTSTIVKFENMAKVKLQAIHYRGAGARAQRHHGRPHQPDVGELQPRGAAAAEKKLKVLGAGGAQRSPQLPGVPTIDESGGPRLRRQHLVRSSRPRRHAAPVVMKINAEVKKILADPAFQQRFMAPQMFESMASSPRSFRSISSRKFRAGRRWYGSRIFVIE